MLPDLIAQGCVALGVVNSMPSVPRCSRGLRRTASETFPPYCTISWPFDQGNSVAKYVYLPGLEMVTVTA